MSSLRAVASHVAAARSGGSAHTSRAAAAALGAGAAGHLRSSTSTSSTFQLSCRPAPTPPTPHRAYHRQARGMAIGSHGMGPAGRVSSMAGKVESAHAVPKSRGIQVNWLDGHASLYNATWLRVNCPANVHASGQRMASPGDVLKVTPTSVEPTTTKEGISVKWSDGHASTYCSKWLRLHDSSVSSIIDRNQASWPVALRSWEAIPKVEYSDFLNSEDGVYAVLRAINATGLCTLENVGTAQDTVGAIAERISPISHSMLYGRTFDVIYQPDARNIAFTRERLRPHQDLAYYESPPGLQLLHCVAYDDSVKGGESLYIDGFEAARQFRKRHPQAFDVLAATPATFQKIRMLATDDSGDVVDVGVGGVDGTDGKLEVQVGGYAMSANKAAKSASYMTFSRPHIEVDSDGEITGIFWAPMFEGTLHVPHKDIQPYYEAYALFQSFLEVGDFAEEHTVRQRMKPGQCVVFNNRRLLHGREGYTGSGERHLQGCYTNIDESLSRYIVLHKDHLAAHKSAPAAERQAAAEKGTIKRWGNGTIPLVFGGV